MSFHECFGPDGCNGCLDVDAPANGGLVNTFRQAERLHPFVAPSLTKADFFALLGSESAKAGAANAGENMNHK